MRVKVYESETEHSETEKQELLGYCYGQTGINQYEQHNSLSEAPQPTSLRDRQTRLPASDPAPLTQHHLQQQKIARHSVRMEHRLKCELSAWRVGGASHSTPSLIVEISST